jgi:hypothetical protein
MGYQDSMNMYQAFNQNPVNFTDPMGAVISKNTRNHFKTWRNAYNFVRYTYGVYIKEGYTPRKAYKKLINTGLLVDSGTKEDYYFALRLSMEPFWGPFDRSPEQILIDTVAGFGDAAGEVASGVAEQALSSNIAISSYESAFGKIEIPNVTKELRGRVQNAMGLGDIDIVDEGSAYYFAGNTLYYSISGGILSAQISTSVYFSQTGRTLPFLSKPVVSKANLPLANALEGLGFEGTQIERIIAARESGQPIVLIGEFQPRVDKMAGLLDRFGVKIQRYVPRNEVEGVTRGALEANRAWLRYWTKNKGGLVIDMGLKPGNIVPSGDFYRIEFNSLYNNWKYKDFIKVKSRF